MKRSQARTLSLALTIGVASGFLGAASTSSARLTPPQDPAGVLESVERFLAERYANFPDRVRTLRVDLPALHARTDSALRAARSDAESRRALEAMLATFRDGHLSLRRIPPRVGTSEGSRASQGVSSRAAAAEVCGAWGYGRSRSRTMFSSLEGYTPLPRDGAPFERGTLDWSGARFAVLRIDTFGLDPHAASCAAAWQNWQASATSATCADACADSLRAVIGQIIADSLRSTVAQLANSGARTLIIDLTGNGGGTEWVSRAVRAISVHRVPPMRIATLQSATPAGSCDPMLAWRDRTAVPCDFRTTRPTNSRDAALEATGPWRGRLVVVIDRNTASAAEQFAANLIDYAAAESIGERSYGSGCGFTSANRALPIPSLMLELRAPDCSRFRADGSNEVDGITPSILADWGDARSARRRAESLLRRL